MNGKRSTLLAASVASGYRRTMRPGVLRAVTHLDLSDDDIERALELVPAGAGSACPRLRHSIGCSPSGRPTGCRASRPRSCATARSCGRTRSARPTTKPAPRRSRTRSTASARSRRRSPRPRSCSFAPRGSSISTTGSSSISTAIANGSPTIRRLLCHLSGLQREAGEMFVTGESPTADELVDSMAKVEFVLAPGAAAPLLEPRLRAARTARRAQARQAVHRLRRRADHPPARARAHDVAARRRRRRRATSSTSTRAPSGREPETDLGGTAPAGQLWSTVEDLCRWASFLASGDDGVLAADAVEEMWFPQVMYYPHDWVLGWGLGLMLHNQRRRDLRRSRRCDGRPPRRRLRRPQDEDAARPR